MAEGTSSASLGLGDLLALLGGSNPLSGVTKSLGQFQRGVSQFLESVDRFNDTMDQLNQVARRVNGLLDAVEEPVRVIVPQFTRTVRTAEVLVEQLTGPIEMVAPGLARLADTLSSPALAALPRDLGQFVDVLTDLARRLQPLGQLAESAGSMFGLRSLAVLRSGGTRPASAPLPIPPPAKKSPAKKSPAKKSPAKKSPAKKAAPRR